MKKRKIIGAILTIAFLMSFMALAAEAVTTVDTARSGSLKLAYGYDGQPIEGITVRVYRVATISENVEFTLTGAFAELPVEVNRVKTQDEWRQVASTLATYVTTMSIPADAESVTDQEGNVSFTELPLGLYLVEGVRAERENGYCQFDSFVISVPNLDETDQWVYDVVAKPKSAFHEVVPQEITYTVNKLWKDEGNTDKRPQNIELEIYRDGVLVETVTLSAENNWTYSWTTVDDGAVWQVLETNVPKGYKVTMEQKEQSFSVINSYKGDEPSAPTGDISNVGLYLMIMCVAGFGLIWLGVTGRRKMAA